MLWQYLSHSSMNMSLLWQFSQLIQCPSPEMFRKLLDQRLDKWQWALFCDWENNHVKQMLGVIQAAMEPCPNLHLIWFPVNCILSGADSVQNEVPPHEMSHLSGGILQLQEDKCFHLPFIAILCIPISSSIFLTTPQNSIREEQTGRHIFIGTSESSIWKQSCINLALFREKSKRLNYQGLPQGLDSGNIQHQHRQNFWSMGMLVDHLCKC